MKSLSIGQESSSQRMSLILCEKNLQNASGREMSVGGIGTVELPMSWLRQRGAVCWLCSHSSGFGSADARRSDGGRGP